MRLAVCLFWFVASQLMTSFILAAKCICSLPRHYEYNFYPAAAARMISSDIIVIKMLQTSLLARFFPVDNFYFLHCKFILTKTTFLIRGKEIAKVQQKWYLLISFHYCHCSGVVRWRISSRTQYFLANGLNWSSNILSRWWSRRCYLFNLMEFSVFLTLRAWPQ